MKDENKLDSGPDVINQKAHDEPCLSVIPKDPGSWYVTSEKNDVEWIMKRGFQ